MRMVITIWGDASVQAIDPIHVGCVHLCVLAVYMLSEKSRGTI